MERLLVKRKWVCRGLTAWAGVQPWKDAEENTARCQKSSQGTSWCCRLKKYCRSNPALLQISAFFKKKKWTWWSHPWSNADVEESVLDQILTTTSPISDEARVALTSEGPDWPLVLSVLEVSSRVSMSSDPIFSKLMVICWVSPLKSWMDTVLDSSSLDNGWGVWADLHRLVKKIKCSLIDWNERRWVSLVNCTHPNHYRL